jgi:hypothetical protein
MEEQEEKANLNHQRFSSLGVLSYRFFRPSVSFSVPVPESKFQDTISDETSRKIIDLCGDIRGAIHGMRPYKDRMVRNRCAIDPVGWRDVCTQ